MAQQAKNDGNAVHPTSPMDPQPSQTRQARKTCPNLQGESRPPARMTVDTDQYLPSKEHQLRKWQQR